ncbi:MAG TPA: FkbM family methyltransferase [Burkholderiaceae bacterium]|jgi:FkbM family methyltransferase|nr:FkbM family methyltransferase [Burkholderiaceae bacterium]
MGRGRWIVTTIGVAAVTAAIGAWAGATVGFRAGQADVMYELVGPHGSTERRSFAWDHALRGGRYNGVYGQDVWVMHRVFPDVRDGYFVDVGSADGELISNTFRLEQRGWQGICVDPFPRNMQRRTCKTVTDAVDEAGGRTVSFQQAGSFSGGILEYAGWWIGDEAKRDTVEVKTTTLAEILDRAGAPQFIHYLNVDIEGAEYPALVNFPFDRYRFGAITIEHNNVLQNRRQLRELLERNGYRLEWAIQDQDWYLPTEPQGQRVVAVERIEVR